MPVISRWTAVAFLLTLLGPVTVWAQGPVTVAGKVTTAADGLALPGATVSIAVLKLSAVTGTDGTYFDPGTGRIGERSDGGDPGDLPGAADTVGQSRPLEHASGVEISRWHSASPKRSPSARAWQAPLPRRPCRSTS